MDGTKEFRYTKKSQTCGKFYLFGLIFVVFQKNIVTDHKDIRRNNFNHFTYALDFTRKLQTIPSWIGKKFRKYLRDLKFNEKPKHWPHISRVSKNYKIWTILAKRAYFIISKLFQNFKFWKKLLSKQKL